MKRHVLIACCKTKLAGRNEAQNCYVSPLFKLSKQYAAKRGLPFSILSAKYGLLEPTELIEPYDQTLLRMNKQERRKWGMKVRNQIHFAFSKRTCFVMLTGRAYSQPLNGLLMEFPLKDLSIGRRLQYLSEFVKQTT